MASAGLILSRSQTADIDDRTPFDINDHFPFRLCWRKQYQSHKMTQMATQTHTTHTHNTTHTHTHPPPRTNIHTHTYIVTHTHTQKLIHTHTYTHTPHWDC